jgi:DmsE family decaheme c-type cytochrome
MLTTNNNPTSYIITLLVSLCIMLWNIADASAKDPETDKSSYTPRGADTCLQCHDEDYDYPVLAIFQTKHGNRNDPRSPMARLQCESCHGPGGEHAKEPYVGQQRAAILTFGRDAKASTEKQNSMCLSCHRDSKRMAWEAGAHGKQNLLCVDCHKIHARNDPVRTARQQADTCYHCHNAQKAQFERTSVHPVRYGKMQCTQCHNVHGTLSDKLLVGNTKNETCYRCHMEKRGPFLWTHAPVQEDCGLCHEHHGSLNKSLLKKRSPLLCQQCHSQGHAPVAYTPDAIDSPQNTFLLAKSCLNCHFQIHGSNHPSGVKLMR